MRRLNDQAGSTLIMVLCITAALFVMGATLVMVTANTQGSTADTKSKDKSLNVAEAAMESTVYQLGNSWPVNSSASPTPAWSPDASAVTGSTGWLSQNLTSETAGEYTGASCSAWKVTGGPCRHWPFSRMAR
jgi:Tfp pilus assembly protein PilX